MGNLGDVYRMFFNPGEVCEIRAYGLSRSSKAWQGFAGGAGIVYGYFDNADSFGLCAEALERESAPGIYFTLNPVIPDLLARSANRLKAATQKTVTTADKDILCVRWIPIDLDPARPTGISSSDPELHAAQRLGEEINTWLISDCGFCGGIQAISGNGYHLVYRLPDLENTDKTKMLIRRILAALDHKFHNPGVTVDQSVFNPARIWKLYGTTARKGDNVPDRPHRRSYIIARDAA